MHTGIGPDGKRLYPAFPYPYFTKMTRDDVLAIRAYLNTLPAGAAVGGRIPDLIWPLQHRVFMRGWDWLFFKEGTFAPDPQKSAEWNRGAYLVEGAGHCGACHTPKNVLGGDKTSEALQGNAIQNWFAPKLANDSRAGLGAWSVDEIVEYLKTGRNTPQRRDRSDGGGRRQFDFEARPTPIFTPSPSTSRTSSVNRRKRRRSRRRRSWTPARRSSPTPARPVIRPTARALHACSRRSLHNANVQSADATSVIRVILEGARTVPTDAQPTPSSMPSFGWKLTDDEIAAVATYVRNSWGNAAAAVGPTRSNRCAATCTRRRNDCAERTPRTTGSERRPGVRALDFMPHEPGVGPSQRRYAGAGRCRPATGRASADGDRHDR